jgi:hypothetical protein
MALDIFPCPFCGSHHLHIVHHHLTHGVTCESCKSQGPHCRRVEDAVVEWNQTSKQLLQAQTIKEHFLARDKIQRMRRAASADQTTALQK